MEAVGKTADSRDLFLRISALSRTKIVPGKTLVFLDEVQECSDILTWVKFLGGRGCDFVLSGSVPGLDLFPAGSLLAGFLRSSTMYPLGLRGVLLGERHRRSVLPQGPRSCRRARIRNAAPSACSFLPSARPGPA